MLTPAAVASPLLPQPRSIWLQRSAAMLTSDCLVVLDAGLYIDRVGAPRIVQSLQADGSLQHVNVVYVSAVDATTRHVELTCNRAFARFLATDLPAWIEQQLGKHERCWLCGLSLSGLQALFTALEHPQVFDGAIAQSPSAWWNEESLSAQVRQRQSIRGRFWLSVGDQELSENVAHPPTGLYQATSQLESCRRLHHSLNHSGAAVHYGEYAGGHDPQCWAAELAEALRWLLNPMASVGA